MKVACTQKFKLHTAIQNLHDRLAKDGHLTAASVSDPSGLSHSGPRADLLQPNSYKQKYVANNFIFSG